ncbi:hypothetical protein ASE75_12390 [Sphingomonas sp. Leaf17]|uniref:DUF2975 domain-containing protein n=1 Tax=Sphingomonas sp. Leaf17 TaxID=1735683 RepID=UPI0007022C16|nr:DUF2975 domain-containing protein [Sphingomonas sp. Leaf17]KQM63270.1 hypothetical protein ASE75_12390 [Sphingomonas sp. Leaf17]
MPKDRIISFFRMVLRIVGIANLSFALFYLVILIGSVPFAGLLERQLIAKYGVTMDVGTVVAGMRGLFVIGIGAAIAIHGIVRNLQTIVATLVEGDPFVAQNARRLQAIGWALLALQLLDLVFGGLTWLFVSLRVDVIDWMPSFTGWLAVLIAFVLARVFARGTAMRDELEATV